jgi:hypothetical protein
MSKLEEARQIQQDAGRARAALVSQTGCVCPLGALARAHGFDIPAGQEAEFDASPAYSGINEEHEADLVVLGTAAAELNPFYLRHAHEIPTDVDPYEASVEVWKYNDRALTTDTQAVELFTKAIELRDAA